MQLAYVTEVGTSSQPHASAYTEVFVAPDGAVYSAFTESTV